MVHHKNVIMVNANFEPLFMVIIILLPSYIIILSKKL